ncbi:MAG: hypothetical protein OCD03_01025 [Hyphomicrobiales bacterium]
MKNLPAIKSVLKAIAYVAKNLKLLFRASVAWVAIYAVFNLISYLLGVAEYAEMADKVNQFASFDKSSAAELNVLTLELEEKGRALGSLVPIADIADKLIQFMAYVAVAVSWSRAYLLAEKPPFMRFGAIEVRFSLYLGALVAGIGFYTWLVARIFNDVSAAMVAISVLIGLFILLMIVARMLMLLPGVAVGDRRMTPSYAWQVTKKNSADIYGGIILLSLAWMPIIIPKAIFSVIEWPMFIGSPVQLWLNMLWLSLFVAYTAICYQYFVPRPKAGDLD